MIQTQRNTNLILLLTTFLIAAAGLVYELLAGTVSAYLLGNSVYHFSLTIGLFMSAMGLGAWLSRLVEDASLVFALSQLWLSLVGGLCAYVLFFAFAFFDHYQFILFLFCIVTGTLVGLEIPLLARILKAQEHLKSTISNILTFDYLGALAASILFPIVLLPHLGLAQTGILFGLLNALVAGLSLYLFGLKRLYWLLWSAVIIILLIAFIQARNFTTWIEANLFESEIIYSETTSYQRLVLTSRDERLSLFLNGNLQFDSLDEHRYHETLVHPVMSLAPQLEHVLILGGGDGLALREVLRYDGLGKITLVDLDPGVTSLFQRVDRLRELNRDALLDDRVTIVHDDAWNFLQGTDDLFDVVIIDLPDPQDLGLSKLYSKEFYRLLSSRISARGLMVTQATSPVYARKAFWSIAATIEDTPAIYVQDRDMTILPYHAYIPSFGDWGFVLAGFGIPKAPKRPLPEGLRYWTESSMERAASFADDENRIPVDLNSIFDHTLVDYYHEGWSTYFR